MDLYSIGNSTNSIQYLVDQYMALESRPRDELIQQKNELSDKKSVFSELDSKLSALKTKLEYLNDIVLLPFQAKKASSSDAEKIGVRVANSASKGNHTLTVQQLAKSDTRVSNQFSDSGTDFNSFTSDQTFTIEVAHPTDSDPSNRVAISITVTADQLSGTNDEAIANIAQAINDAMAEAVANETITTEEVVHADVVNEQEGISRLVLKSEQTGYTYRMEFGASSLLDTLGVNNNALSSGTTGGYIYNVGTSITDSELSSIFELDGLTMYRDSNNVDDAYTGITFKLLDVFSQPVTVSVEPDIDAVKKDVEEFISKYNEVIDFLKENARMNPDTYEKGPLSQDSVYFGMIAELRTMVSEPVDSVANSNYRLLYSIGIEADRDGKLSIKDTEKFNNALEANPSFVSDLFSTSDGVATKLVDYIDRFVKTGGTIDTSKKQIDNRIQSLQDRIEYMNEILDKKEKHYFDEFTKMQQTIYMLQNQQMFFNTFTNFGG
ncbi:MAG TPA: flagellar hook protein FliD [Caldithrix abyssi]|uniref:Flagellar hook-associated protein 2 n=1 Tax=Caldithrix abyssi TaxID=187145 RepID=A0A7V5H2X2_CALAY|nr:flagellar hook protein FliD [Caldithrix abyssi]